MNKLELMRLRIQEENERLEAIKNGTGFNNGNREPSALLAFWNMDYNKDLILRFLPDGNRNNLFFWREIQEINLTFNGIKGVNKEVVTVRVPCIEMFTNEQGKPLQKCPILEQIRPLWKMGEEEKTIAKKYWVKRKYLYQFLVAKNSTATVKDDVAPENPIRRALIGDKIHTRIKSIITQQGLQYEPTDFEHGRDFTITKLMGGQYANYDQSSWSMMERPLSEDELNAINTYGLPDLGDFLPKQPTDEELAIIVEMFEASFNGEEYDPDRWAEFYRPKGVRKPESTPSSSISSDAIKNNLAMQRKLDEQQNNANQTPSQEPQSSQPSNVVTGEEASKANAKELMAKLNMKPQSSTELPTKTVEQSATDNGGTSDALAALRAKLAQNK